MNSKDVSILNKELTLSDIEEHLNRLDEKLGEQKKPNELEKQKKLGMSLVKMGVGFSFLMLPVSYLLGQIVPGSLSADIALPLMMLCGVGVLTCEICSFKKKGEEKGKKNERKR